METAFLARAHHDPPALLLEIEQHARREEVPCIARETGRLLSTLVHAMQANRIFELGTNYGYATLWMALALPPAGRLWTIDPNREHGEIALSYFKRSQRLESIEIITQPPSDVLAAFHVRNLDIVFINAQDTTHKDYISYLDVCIPLLKRSGLIIVEGLLTSPGLEAFSQRFVRHAALDATILPMGGGIGIGARLE